MSWLLEVCGRWTVDGDEAKTAGIGESWEWSLVVHGFACYACIISALATV